MSFFTRDRALLLGLFLLAGALYLPRLNGDWYYLYGEEATGLSLVLSLGSGQGYADISLPGAPPHVREPFLFYFLVSLLYRLFGLNLWAFKGLVVISALLFGPLAFLLFRKLASPWIAFLAALLTVAAPALVDYAALFRPDPLANTLFFATLFLLERYREKEHAFTRLALLGAGCLLAAYLVRSTGLAIALAWPLALALQPAGPARLSLNLKKALLILIPFALGFGLWEHRNAAAAASSNLTYSGRYFLNAPPDSLTIMAEDFHAPLHPPWPQATLVQFPSLILRQFRYYADLALQYLLNWTPGSASPQLVEPLLLFLFALVLLGGVASEWHRRSLSALSLPFYLLAITAWPMRAPRQTFTFLPFLFLYGLLGLEQLLALVKRWIPRLSIPPTISVVAILLLANYLYGDLLIFRQARRVQALPRLEISPGFSARLFSPGRRDSAQALLWARGHLPPDAVLMFHSHPPCYLISQRHCSSIPYEADAQKVRDYLMTGPVDYVLVDNWGKEYPGGPGEFSLRFLEPTLAAFPQDFEKVHQEGQSTFIYRVKKSF
ncbi:MAG: hypothetical protein A2V67_13925 [Deltaproteobacteria bacterium RBG_13_61_14]|nr:MAG: hypothetical protein A2V67_13925 [Deltaproteobacteria bacterium RBG_13_61_14]